ncbi:MAG: stage III sporulation protein AF [Eubacteriales bacterium]|nr:stage III sporulation protein AF [Eubacteriales bacterium]
MKEAVYQWMKNLAVFYILFTAFLHLVPDKKYEKYVRMFMGLLLILLMCTPVFALIGKGEELAGSFDLHYDAETELLKQNDLENLQALYLQKGYEQEIREKIMETAENTGIKPVDAAVHIEGERVSAVLYVWEEPDAEQERRITDALWETCGISEDEFIIRISRDGENTVDHTSASGAAPGSGGDAGIPQI